MANTKQRPVRSTSKGMVPKGRGVKPPQAGARISNKVLKCGGKKK